MHQTVAFVGPVHQSSHGSRHLPKVTANSFHAQIPNMHGLNHLGTSPYALFTQEKQKETQGIKYG